VRIFSLTEDNQKNLWIATMGSGLYCMNLVTLQVDHYLAPHGADYGDHANTLHSNWLFSLHAGRDDKLFIGTVDGLGCLDLKTRSFNSAFGVNRLFPGTMVSVINEDQHGTLWVGTSDGLISFDKSSGNYKTYTVDDGLPSNVICAIQEDALNNLWISTNYGISKLSL